MRRRGGRGRRPARLTTIVRTNFSWPGTSTKENVVSSHAACAKPRSIVIPRAFSSGRRSGSVPVSAFTRALLPWSMCPAVPTRTRRMGEGYVLSTRGRRRSWTSRARASRPRAGPSRAGRRAGRRGRPRRCRPRSRHLRQRDRGPGRRRLARVVALDPDGRGRSRLGSDEDSLFGDEAVHLPVERAQAFGEGVEVRGGEDPVEEARDARPARTSSSGAARGSIRRSRLFRKSVTRIGGRRVRPAAERRRRASSTRRWNSCPRRTAGPAVGVEVGVLRLDDEARRSRSPRRACSVTSRS